MAATRTSLGPRDKTLGDPRGGGHRPKTSIVYCIFVLFVVFIYMSAGCVSTFRTCVQVYLEI